MLAFVDDFFSASPTHLAQQNFDLFKWFVKLLGFSLKERKETPPTTQEDLLGVRVVLLPKGGGYLTLPQSKREKYLTRVRAILKANFIAPGEAGRLAGGLSFASSVALAKFGRPFLQPLYAAASGKLIAPMKDTTLPGDWESLN